METTKVKDVASYLETLAPRSFQEHYDNSGLLTGDPEWIVKGVLVTLDCTEAIVDEAIEHGYSMIVAHHPIIFKGLKKITGQGYVERTIIKAIKNDIAIYAIHTNLDNVHTGVNKRIADRLGLKNLHILVPKSGTLLKLVTFAPAENKEAVLNALYAAGAGKIGNYSHCSFQLEGTGTFLPSAQATPHIGEKGRVERVNEIRMELMLPVYARQAVLSALRQSHPYEEVAYYLTALENEHQEVGAGMVGELPEPMEPIAFLKRLKLSMNTSCVRFTTPGTQPVRKVAVCGGSGSFLLQDAIRSGADAYVSADFKYHEFFDADGKIMVADIGHYESESFTKELLNEVLREKFSTFAINFSKHITNPISYL